MDETIWNYENLANAIIEQAVLDYRRDSLFLKTHPRTKELEETAAIRAEERRRRREERKARGLPRKRENPSREEVLLQRIVDSEAEIREVERFFRSKWYRQLSSVDGELLLGRLREEVAHDSEGISEPGNLAGPEDQP